jgi:hypothetical protein
LVTTRHGPGDQVGCGFFGAVVVQQVEQGFDARDPLAEPIARVHAEAGVQSTRGGRIAIQDQIHGTTVVVVEDEAHCIPERSAFPSASSPAVALKVFPLSIRR